MIYLGVEGLSGDEKVSEEASNGGWEFSVDVSAPDCSTVKEIRRLSNIEANSSVWTSGPQHLMKKKII